MPTNDPNAMYSISAPEQLSMFSIDRFEDRLRQYLHETYKVKTIFDRNNLNEKTKGPKMCIVMKITGQMNEVENAIQDLINLFASIRTRTFDDKTGKEIFQFSSFLIDKF
jgi:hypothetical protein